MLMLAAPLALLGAACLGTGTWLLRTTGTAWRVARLLAVAPQLPLAEVVAAARTGAPPRYVRTHGRISSTEEFPDETERPLVYRRTRLERGDGTERGWRTLNERRLAVGFGIEERGTYLDIDVEALGEGLVVVPREAKGVAREMPPELAADAGASLPPETPVRVRIDQISAVEHATVAGIVLAGDDGVARLTAGLGRPLTLTTVEPEAAMRLLAGDGRRRVLSAGALLVIGLGFLAAAIVAAVLPVPM